MSQSYIIEVGDLAVGILVLLAQDRGFRFVASDPRVRSLEGCTFMQPSQAERRASEILRGKAHGATPRSRLADAKDPLGAAR
jgi:hypothetical protein